MIRHYTSFLAALALLLLSSAVKAQEFVYWIGTHSNDWHTAGNWRDGQLPGSADVVILDNTAIRPLEITTTVNLAGLLMGIQNSQNVTITASGRLNIYGRIDVDAGSLINNGYIDTDGYTNQHDFRIDNEGRLVNNGYIRVGSQTLSFGNNRTTETFINNEGGTLELAYNNSNGLLLAAPEQAEIINRGTILYGGRFYVLFLSDVTNVTFTNSGRVEAAGNGIVNGTDNQIINEACGVIDLRGTGHFDNAGGTTSNAGLILMNGNLSNAHVFTNTGVLRASNYASYTNNGLQINNAPATSYFEYGASNTFSVTGIYKDSSDTHSAGTFTPPNDFVHNSMQANLYARVANSSCTFYVPFVTAPYPLPVSWMDFKGEVNEEGVRLTWSTAQESGNSGFEVYRSSDARSWLKTGFVKAKQTDEPEQRHRNYAYLDAYAPAGKLFYRVRQVDHDGTYSESRIISVQGRKENAMTLYPNPAAEWLHVRLPDHIRPVSFLLLDVQGKVLYDKLPASGKMDVSGLPAGKYYVEMVSQEGVREVGAFVKE